MKEFSSTPFYSGNEVKFTGNVEDRVNLWPMAYWREPVGSVAWPLVSFGNDHFALRPIYSQYKAHGESDYNEFNLLWPIGQFDTHSRDYRIFPLFWGKSYSDNPYFCLFPALWRGGEATGIFPFFWNDSLDEFHIFPLFQSDFSNGNSKQYLFPLYFYNDGDFYSLPYSRYHDDACVKSRILAGLAGSNSSTNTGYESSWFFPLYYHGSNTFVTPLFGKVHDASWIFPLYYRDEDITLATFLYGRSKAKNSEWLFPLYYRDDDSFTTPLFGMDKDSTWLVPIFYSDDQRTIVSPLYGRSKKKNSEWLIPLYHREAGRSFTSLPYSWRGGAEQTNSYFATVLAGTRSGRVQGSWLFPLYDMKKDSSFDHYAAMLDEPRLPDEITIRRQLYTNLVWNAKTKECDITETKWRLRAKPFYSRDEKTFLLLSDADDSINGRIGYGGETNIYSIVRRRKLGNRLFLNRENNRTVRFDASTRGKIADQETAESSFLLFLYNHKRTKDLITKNECKRHTVLWRLWHWEEENGDVALDVFPGFTYDSKTNGYSKTSVLWRFFRYENDTADGKKIDLLFIPIWR